MKRWRAVALILVCVVARAHVQVKPPLYPEIYGSFNEASIAAIAHAYVSSNVYEYGGVILETPEHTFRVGEADTNWSADGVGIDYTNDWSIYKIIADYHTHPCMPFSHYPGAFSDRDVATNIRSEVIGIMGDLCTGDVHEFVPGVSGLDVSWGDDRNGSHGAIIGQIQLWRGPQIVEEYPGPLITHEW